VLHTWVLASMLSSVLRFGWPWRLQGSCRSCSCPCILDSQQSGCAMMQCDRPPARPSAPVGNQAHAAGCLLYYAGQGHRVILCTHDKRFATRAQVTVWPQTVSTPCTEYLTALQACVCKCSNAGFVYSLMSLQSRHVIDKFHVISSPCIDICKSCAGSRHRSGQAC
jgi:hypothetical protein